MPAANFTDAAKALGFKSRSALYRLRDAGALSDYLRPPSSTGSAQLLELQPAGLPPLVEHVRRLIRQQSNTPTPHRRPRTDARWGVVAGGLSEALADCGGLQLSADEAATIAAALPDAVADGFGPAGLGVLRVARAEAGCWLAGPGTPLVPDAARDWWQEWGRWEPGEPLEADAFWNHAAAIVAALMGGPFEQLSGANAAELHRQLGEACRDVEAGARWDAGNWAVASARSLLDDPDCSAGRCPHSLPELERLAAGGLLPPDLQAQAEAALERYRVHDLQSREALPVVLTD